MRFVQTLTLTTIFAVAALLPSLAVMAQQSDDTQPAATEVTPDEQEAANDEESGSFWMEQKLRLSTEVLTGLAESDFDKIGKSAERIRGLNRVEAFVRRGPEGYRDELGQFNMATKALVNAAKNENLEAATLAFNRLTISCVSCHVHLRGEN